MQLLYPGFLFGLLAVAIPIIIHLLQLRRPQRVLFTNTSFIRELELTMARQRRVRHWLILLTRMLAVAFLVLLFCQPFIPAKEGSRTLGNSVRLLVDTSPSMQVAGVKQATLLGEATNQAQDLGKAYGGAARFRLVNENGGVLTAAALQNRLGDLKLSGHSAPLRKLARRQDNQAGLAGSPLYVFSDFQKSEFNAQLLAGLNPQQEVVLVPQVGKPAANVFVDSIWLDDAFVRLRTNVGLRIRLRNGGTVAAPDCPVKVFLGKQQVAAFRTTVAPGQETTTVVQVQLAEPGLALGRVVTEDFPVTFDNTYYFTLRPAPQIRVLEIGAKPLTQRLYTNEPLFSYGFSRPGAIDYGVLRAANLVLVRELPQVEAGLREALAAVVKRGGNVVIVPSAEVKSHDSYQQLFRELGVGAAQWEAPTTTPELREVAMPSARDPFFRDVFGAQQRQVTMPRAAPVLRWSRTGTDVLRLRDGDSFLAGFASGAGQVYVFSAPFAPAYSDFSSHALFVPVLYRLAMLSFHDDQQPAYRLTQASVALTVPLAAGRSEEAGFRLVKDSLTLIPVQRVQGQELRFDMPVGLGEAGFYELQRQGKAITTLAFNIDKRESSLAAYSPAELRQLIGPDRPNVRVLEGNAGEQVARYRAEQAGRPLWRYCLLLALACLLAEGLLLRLLGRRPAAARMQAA